MAIHGIQHNERRASAEGDEAVVARAVDLVKTYGTDDAQVKALDHLSVDFARGEMTAIMGPSGSGKSTLMHCMAGLDKPTSGRVEVEGLEVSSMNQRQLTRFRRDQIGFIFQSFNLVPTLSAEENILLPLQIAKKPIDRAWFDKVVEVVGLGERLSHRPSQLSGGQQQRVACARAIMARPSVIFADEPTGNLDSRTSREVLSFLKHSVSEYGQTIVMVTHDPRAASYADRVLVLADGSITRDLHHPTYQEILQVFAEDDDDMDADTGDGGNDGMGDGGNDGGNAAANAMPAETGDGAVA
ncbi:ABC transporter ATP-binding protein [Bifidobacterium sp. 64T4]|uniref:ABC transporter ATP-binding protein n=1 Tax=Bifidobacterium pongonis TaxID=2834432 RepID=UPI001C5A25D4|nr:ABC transporter ATP-binding protein [Bifidobacterium pongonis]MBW3094197.1 ABC transporter ATP-binding protein [Bifidobacterium pongonis]